MLKKILGCYFLFLFSISAYAEKKLNFALFASRDSIDPFFSNSIDFAKASAESLGFNIEQFYANGDHYLMAEQLKEAINSKRFDAFILMNFKNNLSKTTKICEENNVKYFVYNAGFVIDENYGSPREKLNNWLGEMIPDNEQAGFMLAKKIIDKTPYLKDGKKHILAFSGNMADQAAIKRANGLLRYVNSNKKVDLDQLLYIPNWSREVAVERFLFLHKRYPDTLSYWAVSDNIAIGIYEEAKKNGINIITGSFDWSKIGLEAIKTKKIIASVGGHFMEAAWVSIMLFDYFHGIDFLKTDGLKFKSKMALIDSSNIEKYENVLGKKEDWNKINFKRYSKFYNKNLIKYKFDNDTILNDKIK